MKNKMNSKDKFDSISNAQPKIFLFYTILIFTAFRNYMASFCTYHNNISPVSYLLMA